MNDLLFLRVYSCKLGCNPQKYTFLENSGRTVHSARTPTPVIYIKVAIYTTKENVWLKLSIVQTEQQNVHGFRYQFKIWFTRLYTVCDKAQYKIKLWWKMVRLSELLGNRSNCTKTTQKNSFGLYYWWTVTQMWTCWFSHQFNWTGSHYLNCTFIYPTLLNYKMNSMSLLQ